MRHKLVRYKVKPGAAAENRRLVEAVFEALHSRSPQDLGYIVVELGDGSFVHFKSDFGDKPFELGELPAFQAFGRGIIERCVEPPHPSDAKIVGRYRMMNPLSGPAFSFDEAQRFKRALTTCWINIVRGST